MSLIAHALRSVRAFFAAQQAENELSALSDHELRDIGLSRHDIQGVVEVTRQMWNPSDSSNDNSMRALATRFA